MRSRFLRALLLFSAFHASAQTFPPPDPGNVPSATAILPPAMEWNGRSRELVAPPSDPWITPSEQSGFRNTPSYDETFAWLRKLAAAAPEIRVLSLGKSAEGRDILMVIASKERVFTTEGLKRTGKPVVMAQGGIHAGEIDGKDAGLMLLRDMTVRGRRRDLLDRAHFLFVPIYNVDGHERASRFGRINQRGPEVMGWRTTARNLNLNRDYTKLDAEESRAMVAALHHWKPDLYIDLHVTDGADYQYDITWGWNESTGFSPNIVHWLEGTLHPALRRDLSEWGHIPGPLVFPVGGDDLSKGIALGNAAARLSTGYGDVRRIPTVLVENHSLKPYEQRVLGTLILLQSVLETMGRTGEGLRRAISMDTATRVNPVPLEWKIPGDKPPEIMEFLGIEAKQTPSPISGAVRTEYTGRPVTMRIPLLRQNQVATSVPRAKAYWIPAAWTEIAERLTMHGITIERVPLAREMDVEMYRLREPRLAAEAFEGRVGVTAIPVPEKRRVRFPQGSWRVSTNQLLGDLAAILLEPISSDSFFQWGFFHEVLQRTEYIEDYVTEAMAEKMLAADPKLSEEFRQKLAADEAFRTNSEARLRWFYERTPFFDERWRLYPVAREPLD